MIGDGDLQTYIEDEIDPLASEGLEKWLPLCSDHHVIYPGPPNTTEMDIWPIEEDDREYLEDYPAKPWLIVSFSDLV